MSPTEAQRSLITRETFLFFKEKKKKEKKKAKLRLIISIISQQNQHPTQQFRVVEYSGNKEIGEWIPKICGVF